MKIAIVTCYRQREYVRATTLRRGFAAARDVELLDIRNSHLGLLRYIEVPIKIIKARLINKPEVYVITFRGYEMLLFMALTFTRRSLIFDEFINFTEWMEEHGRLKHGTYSYSIFRRLYAWLVKRCLIILADTDAHANYSAEINNLPRSKYRIIPVGTDESIFKKIHDYHPTNKPFKVFYYGNMLPLHGLKYLLEAALVLKGLPEIEFIIVGGKTSAYNACQAAINAGANIKYKSWIPLRQIPMQAAEAGLSIGGPLGNTLQSKFVITGKTYQFLSLGVPVLIGRNEVNNIFKDKINSLVIPQADTTALVEAITWAQLHWDQLRTIGLAGNRLYQQHFSQAIINRQIQQIISHLSK
ncbi:MAG TPA: hypothetical protein VLF79_04525 [Candidatus Saccharimonadales bacterium]|nr:hypothetical protein [Candidatus Saccharimonadales bacterium]